MCLQRGLRFGDKSGASRTATATTTASTSSSSSSRRFFQQRSSVHEGRTFSSLSSRHQDFGCNSLIKWKIIFNDRNSKSYKHLSTCSKFFVFYERGRMKRSVFVGKIFPYTRRSGF